MGHAANCVPKQSDQCAASRVNSATGVIRTAPTQRQHPHGGGTAKTTYYVSYAPSIRIPPRRHAVELAQARVTPGKQGSEPHAQPTRQARQPIPPSLVILFAALIVAAAIDARTKRIPNPLTFSLMAVGIAVQSSIGEGAMFALQGIGVAFALHFILWQIKLEGAGDAKLMMGVGAFIGWETMLEATLWRYMLQIPYALVVLTVAKRWDNFKAAVRWTILKAQGVDAGERPEPMLMPFGPLIALAVPLAMYTDMMDFL